MINPENRRADKMRRARSAVPYFTAAFLAAVFLLTAYRAFSTNITDDEASTYIFYARPYRLFSVSWLRHMYTTCIANNHWLNTALIHIADLFFPPYSEAAVRLPNLAAFAVYLAAAFAGWRRKRYGLPVLAFLVSNYYLNEFYGLGRGYGLSHTFLFLALLSAGEWRRRKEAPDRCLLLMLLFLSLASMSNTVALLAYPAIGITVLGLLARRRDLAGYLRRHVLSTLLFAAFTLLMAGYHLGVSARDRALYTGTEDFLHSVVLSYVRMLVTSRKAAAAVIILAALASAGSAALLALDRIRRGRMRRQASAGSGDPASRGPEREGSGSDEGPSGREDAGGLFYFPMLLVFIVTLVLQAKLFSKGYITGRAALPFWSLIVLGMGELTGAGADLLPACASGRKRPAYLPQVLIPAGKALIAAAAVLLSMRKVNLSSTTDWPWDYGTRERVAAAYEEYGCYPGELPVQDYADVYYINKYAPLYGAPEYPAKLYTEEEQEPEPAGTAPAPAKQAP